MREILHVRIRGGRGRATSRGYPSQRQGEGELILFDGAPRSATATALEQTLLVAIDRDGLARLLKREADLAAKLLWSIGWVMPGRLRSTDLCLGLYEPPHVVSARMAARLGHCERSHHKDA